jgi:hypothetical protein
VIPEDAKPSLTVAMALDMQSVQPGVPSGPDIVGTIAD